MKTFLSKYYMIIIYILLALFFFKSCQACSKDRLLEFKEIEYEQYKDSITKCNNKLIVENNSLKDSLITYNLYIIELQDKINILKGSNQYFQNTNKILINTNSILTNKE